MTERRGFQIPRPSNVELMDLLKRFGREAESFRYLSHNLTYWRSRDQQSTIAFVATGRSWVTAGAPLCSPDQIVPVIEEFVADAVALHRRVILFAIEAETLTALTSLASPDKHRITYLKIGEQPCFEPLHWTLDGSQRRTIRAQVQRARNHGVLVREVAWKEFTHGARLRVRAEMLIAEWREYRPMSLMGFLVDLHPFHELAERRYIVAEKDGEMVGLLSMVPIFTRRGWFGEDLLRRKTAPNGTAEALVCTALELLKSEQCPYFTLGLAPLSGLEEDSPKRGSGWIPPWLPLIFHLSYHHANFLYSFRGIRQFREKFKPDAWESVFLAVSPPHLPIWVLFDMLSAFIPRSRATFLVDTLLRLGRSFGRRIPLTWLSRSAWAFSLLLVPWIVLLVRVDAEKRFDAAWLVGSWVSFDVMMALAFALLASAIDNFPRLAWSLCRVMLGAVLADVWLTAAQVLQFNLPQSETGLDIVVSLVAVLAPISAAVFLAVVTLALQPRQTSTSRPAG